jgi:uncharacterized protein
LSLKEVSERVLALGHVNIQAIHPSTVMFTKEPHLSKAGDCIVAVTADKAALDLNCSFKDALRQLNSKIIINIEADGLIEQIIAYGSPKLILTHTTDMVIRKSNYICNRTLAINADKAAKDLPRAFVEKLKCTQQKVIIKLTIQT